MLLFKIIDEAEQTRENKKAQIEEDENELDDYSDVDGDMFDADEFRKDLEKTQ